MTSRSEAPALKTLVVILLVLAGTYWGAGLWAAGHTLAGVVVTLGLVWGAIALHDA